MSRRRRRRTNPPVSTLIGLGIVAAVAFAWWKSRSSSGFTQGVVAKKMPDGTVQNLPAWFAPDGTVTHADGTKSTYQQSVPDTYYDANQYGGRFVGPPTPTDN